MKCLFTFLCLCSLCVSALAQDVRVGLRSGGANGLSLIIIRKPSLFLETAPNYNWDKEVFLSYNLDKKFGVELSYGRFDTRLLDRTEYSQTRQRNFVISVSMLWRMVKIGSFSSYSGLLLSVLSSKNVHDPRETVDALNFPAIHCGVGGGYWSTFMPGMVNISTFSLNKHVELQGKFALTARTQNFSSPGQQSYSNSRINMQIGASYKL